MKKQHQKRTTVLNSQLNPDMKFKVTEAYKAARTNLAFSVLKQGCKKIVVTSSLAGEGKSTSAVNVAISLAQQSGTIVPNPSELLASEAMQELLQTMEKDFDYIILDTPPINVVIDALPLMKITDGVVIVVKEDFSTHPELAKTIEKLERVDAKILGIILNGAKMESKDNYKYHYERYE